MRSIWLMMNPWMDFPVYSTLTGMTVATTLDHAVDQLLEHVESATRCDPFEPLDNPQQGLDNHRAETLPAGRR